jgi:hypothetical protein
MSGTQPIGSSPSKACLRTGSPGLTRAFKGLYLILFVSLLAGCEGLTVEGIDVSPQTHPLKADSLVTLQVNDFTLTVDRSGQLSEGYVFTLDRSGQLSEGYISNTHILFRAGLWLGTIQQGQIQGSICWDGTYPSSNYTAKWGNKNIGVYYIDPTTVASAGEPWPTDYGFPMINQGQPRVYGDGMCWSALGPDTSVTSVPILSNPVRNVLVTEAVYGYKRADLRTVAFVRYDVTNLGNEVLQCYAGFYSDTDLGDAENSTGYDSSRGLSYTYENPSSPFINWTTGFTALETPRNGATEVGILSHRIMRKNNYINPEFGEYGFTSPQQILWALQGLDNNGRPLINPITNMPTKFAFTGDPVDSTGWLDVQVDVRSMITMGPFPLLPDQTQTITIVWIVGEGSSLSDALNKLKKKTDDIRREQELWKY